VTTNHTAIPEFLLQAQRARLDPWGRGRGNTDEVKAITAKLNEQARENWDNQEWRRQVAADIVEELDFGFFNGANMFAGFIDTQAVGEFDRVVVRERRGLKIFETSRGGYINESNLEDELYTMGRSTYGFAVKESTDRLRANFAELISEVVAKGEQLFDATVNKQILSLAQAATPVGSAYHTASVGLTKAEVDDAIRRVRDAIRPDGVNPPRVTIVGRSAMIEAIGDFAGNSYQPIYADPALEEIRSRGYLGTYRGASMVQLVNYADSEGTPFLPSNELWVLGGSAGKFVFYGGAQVKLWDENAHDVTRFRTRRDMGGAIFKPALIHRVSDASVSGS
jgi:hypothetical protein